jgi:hypothetical protein
LSEVFCEKSDETARAYLDARQKLGSVKGRDFGKIQHALSQLEEAQQKLPETSLLRSKLGKQADELKKQIEESGEMEKEFDNHRRQLLELTANSFEIDPEGNRTLSESYVKAITDVLFKRERAHLEFQDCSVSASRVDIQGDNTQVLITSAHVSEFVREAAKKMLGRETMLNELWIRITNADTMFKVYSILASNDRILTAVEIATLINETGWDRVKVKNTLVNLLLENLFSHKLIRRVEEGKYQVSDVGRFLWQEFGRTAKEEREGEEMSASKIPSQTMLNNWSRPSSG